MHLCHGFYMNSKPPITFKRVGQRWTGSAHFLALSYECSFVGHNILRTLCHNFLCYFVMFPWLENTMGAHPFPFTPPQKAKSAKKSWFIFLFLPREPRRLLDGCDFLPTTDLQNLQKRTSIFWQKNTICDINLFILFISPTLSISLIYLFYFFFSARIKKKDSCEKLYWCPLNAPNTLQQTLELRETVHIQ